MSVYLLALWVLTYFGVRSNSPMTYRLLTIRGLQLGVGYRLRRLSSSDLMSGLSKYSIARRVPVLISTVTAMPGER